jgi:cell division protein FtsB
MISVQVSGEWLKPYQIANLVQDLADECEAAEKEIARLEGENKAYEEENADLKEQVMYLRRLIAECGEPVTE